MLIIWIFYFIFGCWGNLALNQAYVVVFVWVFFFFSFFLSILCIKLIDFDSGPSLHIWNVTYLIMVDDLFDMFLYLVLSIVYLWIYVHK